MYLQILKILYNNFQESSCEIVRRMNTEQEIVSRLKFIGKVKKGEKINTHHMCVQPEGLITNLKRRKQSFSSQLVFVCSNEMIHLLLFT